MLALTLPLDHLTPLFGMDELDRAVTDLELSKKSALDHAELDVSAVNQALDYLQRQLSPLPECAKATTYGLVLAVCRFAVNYAVAVDGEVELIPVTPPSDKSFRAVGWLLSAGHLLRDFDLSDEPNTVDISPDSAYINIAPIVPTALHPATEGLLLPISTSLLFDPRPRMN